MKHKLYYSSIIAIIIMFSCNLGDRLVEYDELNPKPYIRVWVDSVNVEFNNSIKNSSLIIYKFDFTKQDNKIIITAHQAIGKTFKRMLSYNSNEIDISFDEFSRLEWYWQNSDKTIVPISKVWTNSSIISNVPK